MRLVNRFFYFRQNCWLKRLGSILLLCLMLQYSFGLHILYAWNSFVIRQFMKSAIASGTFHYSQIVTFHIATPKSDEAANDFLEEEEIELNGKMYDVVSAKKEDKHIVIRAICDDDETSLVTAYQQVMGSTKQSLPDKNLAWLKSCFSPFIINIYQPVLQQAVQNEKDKLFYEANTFPVNLYIKVLKPPPRLA